MNKMYILSGASKRIHLVLASGLLNLLLGSCALPFKPIETTAKTPAQSATWLPDASQVTMSASLESVPTMGAGASIAVPEISSANLRCDSGVSIIFLAANISQESKAIYRLCQEDTEPSLIAPIPDNISIHGLDLAYDGRLVYSGSDTDTNIGFLSGQLFANMPEKTFSGGIWDNLSSPQWVLDGTQVVVIQHQTPSSLAIVDLTTGTITPLFEAYTLSSLSVSPGSNKVLFKSSTGQPNVEPETVTGTIHCDNSICQLDSVQKIDNVGSNPNWAENGSTIASFIFEDVQDESNIYLRVTSLDGAIEQEIDLTGLDPALAGPHEVIWTPDQFLIIGYSDDANSDNIYSVSSDGFSLKRKTQFRNMDLLYLLSHEGTK